MLAGVTLFIVIVGLITKTNRGEKTILSPYLHTAPQPSNLKAVQICSMSFLVTVADNDAARAKGLSSVTNLPDNQRMRFIFNNKNLTPQMARFWMNDMKIPLDFIWISNGK